MKYFLLLLFIGTNCFAQNDYNKVNAEGKKEGMWRGFYPESKRLRYEGTFKNGVEEGVFKFFDDTKAQDIVATRTFSENGTVALNQFFDQKKNLVSEGKTINRKNEGEWKYYHKESKDLKMVEFYKNGLLSGVRKIFYSSNKIADETTFVEGKKNGQRKIYTQKGIVTEESNFKNDEFDGYCIYKNPTGQIVSQGNYQNGIQKGKWQFFENGKLVRTEMLPKQKKFAKKNERKIN